MTGHDFLALELSQQQFQAYEEAEPFLSEQELKDTIKLIADDNMQVEKSTEALKSLPECEKYVYRKDTVKHLLLHKI